MITKSNKTTPNGYAFVFKSRSLEYFCEVANGVVEGEFYFPEAKIIPMPMGEAPLTEREMEVLRLMCKHVTSKEIADELYISENTVKYHKSNRRLRPQYGVYYFACLPGGTNAGRYLLALS